MLAFRLDVWDTRGLEEFQNPLTPVAEPEESLERPERLGKVPLDPNFRLEGDKGSFGDLPIAPDPEAELSPYPSMSVVGLEPFSIKVL